MRAGGTVIGHKSLLERPEETQGWMVDAVCRQHPGVDFFPKRGDSARAAILICRGCPVSDRCLEYALSLPRNTTIGVWGGTTGNDRHRILRDRGR